MDLLPTRFSKEKERSLQDFFDTGDEKETKTPGFFLYYVQTFLVDMGVRSTKKL